MNQMKSSAFMVTYFGISEDFVLEGGGLINLFLP